MKIARIAVGNPASYPPSWPASATMRDLSDPVWLSAYCAARAADPGKQAARAATASVRAAQRMIREATMLPSRAVARAAQDSIIRPPRPAAPAVTMHEALSRKHALIATARLSRATVDMLDATIKPSEPFFFVRDLDDYTRSHEAGHQPIVRNASDVIERPTRGMRSKTTEIVEQMERHQRRMELAFGSVAPVEEPIPGLDGSLIRPLPAIPPQPPRDEVMAQLQERATAWLEIFCPKALTRMTAAHEALLRSDEESISHAVSSCRRALTALADVVEPPAPGARPDHTGQERKVGRDEYKNRLVLHFGKRVTSKSGRKMNNRELELAHRLDALVERLGKGVHDDYHYDDAAHIYFTTWGLIAEVVRFSES